MKGSQYLECFPTLKIFITIEDIVKLYITYIVRIYSFHKIIFYWERNFIQNRLEMYPKLYYICLIQEDKNICL